MIKYVRIGFKVLAILIAAMLSAALLDGALGNASLGEWRLGSVELICAFIAFAVLYLGSSYGPGAMRIACALPIAATFGFIEGYAVLPFVFDEVLRTPTSPVARFIAAVVSALFALWLLVDTLRWQLKSQRELKKLKDAGLLVVPVNGVLPAARSLQSYSWCDMKFGRDKVSYELIEHGDSLEIRVTTAGLTAAQFKGQGGLLPKLRSIADVEWGRPTNDSEAHAHCLVGHASLAKSDNVRLSLVELIGNPSDIRVS